MICAEISCLDVADAAPGLGRRNRRRLAVDCVVCRSADAQTHPHPRHLRLAQAVLGQGRPARPARHQRRLCPLPESRRRDDEAGARRRGEGVRRVRHVERKLRPGRAFRRAPHRRDGETCPQGNLVHGGLSHPPRFPPGPHEGAARSCSRRTTWTASGWTTCTGTRSSRTRIRCSSRPAFATGASPRFSSRRA